MSWSESSNKIYKDLIKNGIDPDYYPEELMSKENKGLNYYWQLTEDVFNSLRESGELKTLYPNCPDVSYQEMRENFKNGTKNVKEMLENMKYASKLKDKDLCNKINSEILDNISLSSLEYALIQELIDRFEEKN